MPCNTLATKEEEGEAVSGRSAGQRSRDPKWQKYRKLRVDEQALKLIHERIAIFGPKWRENCAIRVPKNYKDPYEGEW